jgi:hypothetical protein
MDGDRMLASRGQELFERDVGEFASPLQNFFQHGIAV